MEDGVKGDTAKPKEATSMGKAGWVKKSTRKFLGSYKDRYIQLEKTEILVYENEDLKNCLERVDLENYDKCHELGGVFKKKNRLILIRAQKCGNKIQDIKIQTQTPEDKDAWIKALSEAINRAKNKIFDEVKVDESCSLEHVTRTRPKGNQGRRPPTRIHMKEVANQSSDGILRKDLDAFDNTPNGTHQVSTEADAPKEAVKPPMPPSQRSESPQETAEAEPTPQKKVLKPPMPPSKQNKPNSPGEGETPKDVETAPPMPPKEANGCSEEPDSTGITLSPSSPPPPEPIQPPKPPSKDKKPTQTVEWEVPDLPSNDSEEESPEETLSDDLGKSDSDKFGSDRDSTPPPQTAFKPPEARPNTPVPEEADETSAQKEDTCPTLSAPEKGEPDHSNVALEAGGNPEPAITLGADIQRPAAPLTKSVEPSPQLVKKNPGPPAPPKKKPLNRTECDQTGDLKEGSAEVSVSGESMGAGLPNERVPASVISDVPKHKNDLTPTIEPKDKMVAPSSDAKADATVVTDSTVQKRKQAENGDRSRQSDEEPQGGESRGASVSTVGSGRERLHGDGSEAEAKSCMSQEGKVNTGATARAQMLKQVQTKRCIQRTPPALLLNPSKAKSASVTDILSESMVHSTGWAVEEISRTSPRNDTNELHSKVALELENTVELLDALSSERETLGGTGGPKSLSPEELLGKAVEKLRKADQFLQEAKSLKQANPLGKMHRMSW